MEGFNNGYKVGSERMGPWSLEKASSKDLGFYVTRMTLDGGELFGDPFLHFARDAKLWGCVPRKSFQYVIAILQRRRDELVDARWD